MSMEWTPDTVDRTSAARALLCEAAGAAVGNSSGHFHFVVPRGQVHGQDGGVEGTRGGRPANEVLADMYHEHQQRHGQQDVAEFWTWCVFNQYSMLGAGAVQGRVRWEQGLEKLEPIAALYAGEDGSSAFNIKDWQQ